MPEICPICGGNECAFFLRAPAQMHPTREEFDFMRCAGCGYVFLADPVETSRLHEFYTDHYLPYRGAKAWGRHASRVERSDFRLNMKRVGWVADAISKTAGSTVLDIGCGRPDFLLACRRELGVRAVGVDFSDHGWRDDSARFSELELIVGGAGDVPEHIKPDVVTMWHYLEHDYAPAATLRMIAEKCEPGAKLIIEVPDFDSESRRQFGKFWAGWHTPRHISLFSALNLRMLLEKNGWRVERINQEGTLDPYVLYWMSRMEERGIDWTQSMEGEFVGFVAGMLAFLPKRLSGKPLGLLSALATRE